MARRRTMLSADGKAVWFWHPLLVLNLRRRVGPTGLGQTFNPQMTVARRIRRRGERGISRKTIARGMPGDFRCTCGDYARVLCFISHARLRVQRAPGIPCALCFLGRTVLAPLGRIAPRECGVVSQIRHPCVTASPLSLEVRALRCTCTAGRASKDERPRIFELRVF